MKTRVCTECGFVAIELESGRTHHYETGHATFAEPPRKGFDDVLRDAFMAGVRYADDTDTPVIAEEFWREWPDAERFYRKWRAQMADEPPVGVRPGDAVGRESAEDESRSNAIPRPATSDCRCKSPDYASPVCPVHGKNMKMRRRV